MKEILEQLPEVDKVYFTATGHSFFTYEIGGKKYSRNIVESEYEILSEKTREEILAESDESTDGSATTKRAYNKKA